MQTRSVSADSRISVFNTDLAALHRLANMHSLQLPPSEGPSELHAVILSHLVNGGCFLPPPVHSRGKTPCSPHVCRQISAGFSSSRDHDFSSSVLDLVVADMNVPYCVPRLIDIANALPLLRLISPTDTHCN
jgi:hypothetical protein